MPLEFRCFQCQALLRVPDDASGRQTVCPACGAALSVPPSQPASEPAEAASAAETENPFRSPETHGLDVPPTYESWYSRRYAESRVSGPSTWLIVTGAVGLPLKVINIAGYLLVFDPVGANRRAGGAIWEQGILVTPEVGLAVNVIGVALCFVIIFGAIKMRNLDNYGISMAAAAVAMVPIVSPCCLLGIPFGIWALAVLCDHRVKAQFRT